MLPINVHVACNNFCRSIQRSKITVRVLYIIWIMEAINSDQSIVIVVLEFRSKVPHMFQNE